jgi:hypothetical protein
MLIAFAGGDDVGEGFEVLLWEVVLVAKYCVANQ